MKKFIKRYWYVPIAFILLIVSTILLELNSEWCLYPAVLKWATNWSSSIGAFTTLAALLAVILQLHRADMQRKTTLMDDIADWANELEKRIDKYRDDLQANSFVEFLDLFERKYAKKATDSKRVDTKLHEKFKWVNAYMKRLKSAFEVLDTTDDKINIDMLIMGINYHLNSIKSHQWS